LRFRQHSRTVAGGERSNADTDEEGAPVRESSLRRSFARGGEQ
jgi:hypothetical protein